MTVSDDFEKNALRRFLSDHPGNPLGRGMPMGRAWRIEVFHEPTQMWRGESHLMAWERILRADPCAYCGEAMSGTVDHIEPKRKPVRGLGGAFSWINVVGACQTCNGRKKDRPLLGFLRVRAVSAPRVAAAPGRRVVPDSTKEAA